MMSGGHLPKKLPSASEGGTVSGKTPERKGRKGIPPSPQFQIVRGSNGFAGCTCGAEAGTGLSFGFTASQSPELARVTCGSLADPSDFHSIFCVQLPPLPFEVETTVYW